MNIIELAQECQLIGMRPHLDGIYQEALEKFSALVAAHEREAIATWFDGEAGSGRIISCISAAKAIRARGTT